MTPHEKQAYDLGVEAALAAASWVIDGNHSGRHYATVLDLIDDGDPRADEYLPAYPNLSGEYADDPTPHRLYLEIVGCEFDPYDDGVVVDALADAWEQGVSDTFLPECERLLRAALD